MKTQERRTFLKLGALMSGIFATSAFGVATANGAIESSSSSNKLDKITMARTELKCQPWALDVWG